MGYFLIYSIFTATSISVASMILGKKFLKHLKEHERKVIAMVSGTSTTMLLGISLAVFYTDYLLLATLIGISSGLFLGGLNGITLGFIPAFEGAMSGFMGGMMGVMLGAMLPLEDSYLLVQLFMVFALCSLMLFGIFLNKQSDKSNVNRKWFIKPLFISILIIGYMLTGNYFSQSTINETPVQSHHHKH
ncbi:hypothetical protein LCL89_05100 [Halobacillus yeomjeoni]|uniref:hypothetical protein n=1 Tax=Halobacillus yeomjeoni TaxID=311194 RepID=UPI001CD6986A|nr:hypothetical protein [Halobacillus yeomjeoni]MCA0983428.1 hypothetical protein [Halobacillus yeomjeoni]